ncbi:MAG: hypothetical protein ACLSAF_10635 [Intestinimonas sp.]
MTGCPASGRNHSARLPKASHFEGLVQKQESLEILVVLGFQGFLAACAVKQDAGAQTRAKPAFWPAARLRRIFERSENCAGRIHFAPSILISYGIHKNTHTILVWVFYTPMR